MITYRILNNDYPLVVTPNAIAKIEDEFCPIEKIGDMLADEDSSRFKIIVRLLEIAIEAGIKYCELIGEKHPEPLKCSVGDVMGVSDITPAFKCFMDALNESMAREVEVVSKNAKSTPGD